jgi:hypothetical protein
MLKKKLLAVPVMLVIFHEEQVSKTKQKYEQTISIT